MKRFVVLLAFGGALAVFGVVACGGGDGDKPPLSPDTELPKESPTDIADAAPTK